MNTQASFGHLGQALKAVRERYPDWPIQRLSILLLVGLMPGASMGELAAKASVSLSSVSRNVSVLAKGHGLVRAEPDPLDTRKQVIRPTKEGLGFLEHICGLALRR